MTKEQAARAREIHALDYVMKYERDSLKRVGSTHRLRSDDSLAVNAKGFYCHKTHAKGVTALDYLIYIHNYHLVDAVCHLINESPYQKGDRPGQREQSRPSRQKSNINKSLSTPATSAKTTTSAIPPENNPHSKQQIQLPRRNKDNYHVIAYLQNRGIDRDVIMGCINSGILYESALHHNAVFLGKDENSKTRFAAMRGINGDFKCDAEGSNKKYAFLLPPKNPKSQVVMLFESPIDCLSHQTLCKRGDIPDYGGWRVSLGGTSSIALTHFLEQHPEISHCIIATDNDEAGNKAAERIADEISITSERVHPLHGKDWNDALLLALRVVRGKEHANEHAKPHKLYHKQDTPEL